MRTLQFCMILIIFPVAAVHAVEPYQLPNIEMCNVRSCAISIDGGGFLRDSASHEKIFELPLAQTVFDSYSLMKAGRYYIVERSNTTSSKNWNLLVLSYLKGVARAVRLISLSRSYAMTSPQVYWNGYECRGNALPETRYSPFDAVEKALCRGVPESDSIRLSDNEVNTMAKRHGLIVNVPLYGAATKENTTYFFPGVNEPDSGALLCVQNCGLDKEPTGRFGGWIGASYWIDAEIHEGPEAGNLAGRYIYVGKNEKIEVNGNIVNGKLRLIGSIPDRAGGKRQHAVFDGSGSKEAFAGKWHFVESGKLLQFFIASRIY